MKTAIEIVKQAYDEIVAKYPDENWSEFQKDHTSTEIGIRIVELSRSNLWTSPCDCPPDEKTGETWCCNRILNSLWRLNNAVYSGGKGEDIMTELKNKIIQQLRFHRISCLDEDKTAFFIMNLLEEYRSQPHQELPGDEEIKRLKEELEEERNSVRLITKKTVDNISQPKIQMVTACGRFEPNPMFTTATLCKNCGKEKALHVTPPKTNP